MKRPQVARELPLLLAGALLAGLLTVSSLSLSASPARSADKYFVDVSIDKDLSFKASVYAGEKEDLSASYDTEDSTEICEQLEIEERERLRGSDDGLKEVQAIASKQVEKCTFSDPYFFIEYSGKYDEEMLKKTEEVKPDRTPRAKFNEEGDLVINPEIPWDLPTYDGKTGIIRYTFPGKIKSVSPEFGKISGNTWALDKPLTEEQNIDYGRHGEFVTLTAQIHSSKLGLILGITIPATLIIVAVIALLIVRSNRKRKQQHLPPYPAGSGAYPPSPFMPGNSANPAQSRVPGYPAAPGTPDIQGGDPYPPNVPPQAQPGTPMPGGYYPYPYPYPYPPANPQAPSGGYYPAPNQGYGTPTPGFPPPDAPPYPEQADQSGKPWHPEESTPGIDEENGKETESGR